MDITVFCLMITNIAKVCKTYDVNLVGFDDGSIDVYHKDSRIGSVVFNDDSIDVYYKDTNTAVKRLKLDTSSAFKDLKPIEY